MSLARIVPILLVAACAPKDDPGDAAATTTTTTTTSGTSDAPPTSGGSDTTEAPPDTTSETGEACLEHHEPCSCDTTIGPWQLTCDLPPLCPGDDALQFTFDDWDPHGDLPPGIVMVDDLERARCVAAALRDRSFGQYDFITILDFSVLDAFSHEILGDKALRRSMPMSCHLSFPPICRDTTEHLTRLRPAEFFADCVEGDARALWLCISDAFETDPACAPGPLSCPLIRR